MAEGKGGSAKSRRSRAGIADAARGEGGGMRCEGAGACGVSRGGALGAGQAAAESARAFTILHVVRDRDRSVSGRDDNARFCCRLPAEVQQSHFALFIALAAAVTPAHWVSRL
eukprot:693337-Prymnesium_polylepis.1